MEFLHWVTVYNDVMSELYGEDKDEAMKVIDDDAGFDAWLKRYANKNKTSHKNTITPGAKKVEKDLFFRRMKGSLPQPKHANATRDDE